MIVPYLRGYGTTRFLSDETSRNGEQAALALDTIALMDALGIEKAIVAGFDWGARTADIVAALWPERCKALVSVSGYLIGSQAAGQVPLPPEAELQWWYQYYFATERGRAGYEKYRREFAKLIWKTASPRWNFDDATFDRTAASFDNPDHVAIVIHNYRWRLGLADGEPEYAELEQRLAEGPLITVPTITLEGDANGAPHPEPAAYAAKFSGPYVAPDHRGWHRSQPSAGSAGGFLGSGTRPRRSIPLSLFDDVSSRLRRNRPGWRRARRALRRRAGGGRAAGRRRRARPGRWPVLLLGVHSVEGAPAPRGGGARRT